VTGWNISRAAASAKIQKKITEIIKEKRNQLCKMVQNTTSHMIEPTKALISTFERLKKKILSQQENISAFAA